MRRTASDEWLRFAFDCSESARPEGRVQGS
jgi:hypothetical protein